MGGFKRTSQRVGGLVSGLRRRHRHLRLGTELTHFAHLLIIRDDLADLIAQGKLQPQYARALTETCRQIESVGSRLGIFSPAPKAGEAARPITGGPYGDYRDYLDPTGEKKL